MNMNMLCQKSQQYPENYVDIRILEILMLQYIFSYFVSIDIDAF